MLEEKVGYLRDFPMNIKLVNIKNYPLHYHTDIEFIYVLRGFVTLKCGSSIYKMQQGDIFTVNESEVHGIFDCSKDNAILLIRIEMKYFVKLFPTLPSRAYRTMGKERSSEGIVFLRNNFLQIGYNFFSKAPGYKLENVNIMIDILHYLEAHFSSFYFEGKIVMHKKYNQPELNERVSRVITYIYAHYNEKITLKELADMEFLSEFYLSHLITAGTGLNFRELLSFARVECSEKILLESETKVSNIAKAVGFSTTQYYKKFFKKWYRCYPEEYREMYANHIKGADIEEVSEIDNTETIPLIIDAISFLSFDFEEDIYRKFQYIYIHIDSDKKPVGSFVHNIKLHNNYFESKEMIYNIDLLMQILNIEKCMGNNKEKINTKIYAWDSLIFVPYLMSYALENSEVFLNSIIDERDKNSRLISGNTGLFTAEGIPKPAYFAYKILNLMQGDILEFTNCYIVTKSINNSEEEQLNLLFYNCSDELKQLCEYTNSSIREINDKIMEFKNSMEIKVDIQGLAAGVYQVVEMIQNYENSLFYLASRDNFGRKDIIDSDVINIINISSPKTICKEHYVDNKMEFKVNLKGLGFKFIRIIKK